MQTHKEKKKQYVEKNKHHSGDVIKTFQQETRKPFSLTFQDFIKPIILHDIQKRKQTIRLLENKNYQKQGIAGNSSITFQNQLHMKEQMISQKRFMNQRFHNSFYNQDEEDITFQNFHNRKPSNPSQRSQTISHMKSRVQMNIQKLLLQFDNFKMKTQRNINLQTLKNFISKQFTNDFTQIQFDVKQSKKRIFEFKIDQLSIDYHDLYKIFNQKLLQAVEKLKLKIQQTFIKANSIIISIKNQHEINFKRYDQDIESLERNYFDYNKTQLVRIALSESIPEFYNMKYYPCYKQNLNIKQPLKVNSISSMYRTVFNDKTFSGLQERSWVHNSVIDNYVQYLRYMIGYNNPLKSKSAIYSFGQSLMFQKPETYRFASGPIFTRYQRVGLIINQKDEHWYFVGILPLKGKVIIYDSVPRKSTHYTPILQGLRKFIQKQVNEFSDNRNFTLNQFDDETTPKQENGSDCGIHVLWNLTYFLQSRTDNEDKISFNTQLNNSLRIGMYHFMAYLFSMSRQPKSIPNYDWLQYCSRSIMTKQNGSELWK